MFSFPPKESEALEVIHQARRRQGLVKAKVLFDINLTSLLLLMEFTDASTSVCCGLFSRFVYLIFSPLHLFSTEGMFQGEKNYSLAGN